MKRILITTILLASGLANAGSINTKILHDAFKGTPLAGIKIAGTTQPDPQPPIQPIRQAKARIRVMKQTYTQNGTQFEVKQEDVCLMNASVDIFDMRNNPNAPITLAGPNATCASTVNGQPVNISIIAIGAYVDDSFFPNDPKTDYKGFGASLVIDNTSAPTTDSSFMTTDLNIKSATLTLIPHTETTCSGSSCSVNYPESFNAIVEITD